MPRTSTVLPGNPPSVKRDPFRTSVSSIRRSGANALAVAVTALVAVATPVADGAAKGVAVEAPRVAAGVPGPAQAAIRAPATTKAVARTSRIWQQYVRHTPEVLPRPKLTPAVACAHRGAVTVTDVLGLGAHLPTGYRAREFNDGDRDTFVEERNREQHWMQQGSAAEWRYWENLMKDPALLRVTVEAPNGSVAAIGDIGVGFTARPDGSQFVGMTVLASHRRKGIGTAMLDALEDEARRRKVPKLFAGAGEDEKFALDWAIRHGYREIGRRIASYVELSKFEPERFSDAIDRVRAAGITISSFAEELEGKDDAARERWWRALYAAEEPMWADIPFATPTPHWPWERFYEASTSEQMLLDLCLIANAGDQIAGFTTTGKSKDKDGWTWLTGTAREHRGRGVAMALKVEMLARAKRRGLRAIGTTNDEPNKSMRGINAKLGYQMLPAHVELEKRLA
jgi:mycothiol synthase